MIRTQIQLTEAQMQALRRKAATEGRSMADVIRAGLDRMLEDRVEGDREAAKRRSLDALGQFRSGTADLGGEHDRHLSETWADR